MKTGCFPGRRLRWYGWLVMMLFSSMLAEARGDEPVSLAFDDVPVQRVLQALADHQQLNLVVAPGVTGNVSLNLQQVPWQQALDIILRMGQLTIERQDSVMMVYPDTYLKDRQRQQEELAANSVSNCRCRICPLPCSMRKPPMW